MPYDRLVLSPGVDMRFDGLPGYSEAARRNDAACLEGWASRPYCCAGSSRRWPNGGLCRDLGARQPVPLPARSVRARQPDRELSEDQQAGLEAALILDAKDNFSKQSLFQKRRGKTSTRA